MKTVMIETVPPAAEVIPPTPGEVAFERLVTELPLVVMTREDDPS